MSKSLKDERSDWVEWHGACDLDLCGVETRERLLSFARYSFVRASEKQLETNSLPPLPDQAGTSEEAGSACWAHIEDRLLTKRHKSGKTYKYYVCDHAALRPVAEQHATFREGFATQMRNVVRSYFSAESRTAKREKALRLFSLDKPVAETGEESVGNLYSADDSLAVSASLFSSIPQVEQNEFRGIAAELSGPVFALFDDRMRYALWATLNGISLATPALLKRADCGKSQFYQAKKNIRVVASEQIDLHYGAEDSVSIYVLKVFLLDALEHETFLWGKSENLDCACFKGEGDKL